MDKSETFSVKQQSVFAVWSLIMALVYIIASIAPVYNNPPAACLSLLCALANFTILLSYLLLGVVGLYITRDSTNSKIIRFSVFTSGLIFCTIVGFFPKDTWMTSGLLILIPLLGTILGCIGIIQTHNNTDRGRWMALLGLAIGLISSIISLHLILPALRQFFELIVYLPIILIQ